MSELLRGHFPTGLEKDYTVAGNSRGCWFSNPFYSAFVSAFSCVLPLGWARRKSALASLLISMHEADVSRAGIRAERHQSFYTALGSRQRARWRTQPSTWAWRGHTMWHGMGLARCCLEAGRATAGVSGAAGGTAISALESRAGPFSSSENNISFLPALSPASTSKAREQVAWPFCFSVAGPHQPHRRRASDLFHYRSGWWLTSVVNRHQCPSSSKAAAKQQMWKNINFSAEQNPPFVQLSRRFFVI